MVNSWKEDKRSIISPCELFLTTELLSDAMAGFGKLYSRYLEVMGHGTTPLPDWQGKEDYVLQAICKGLGRDGERFVDVINEALMAGGLLNASFLTEMERELKITGSDG